MKSACDARNHTASLRHCKHIHKCAHVLLRCSEFVDGSSPNCSVVAPTFPSKMAAQAQALVRSASKAGKQVLEHPQLKQAVEQATEQSQKAQGLISTHYSALLKNNRQYILGSGPGFFVTKGNLHKVAFYTALAEYEPISLL